MEDYKATIDAILLLRNKMSDNGPGAIKRYPLLVRDIILGDAILHLQDSLRAWLTGH